MWQCVQSYCLSVAFISMIVRVGHPEPFTESRKQQETGMGIGRGFPLEKKMSAQKKKTVRSNWNVMVLRQVKNWQNWKIQGCFMQFLRLVFVKKLQAPAFQLTFPFLIPMPEEILHFCGKLMAGLGTQQTM